jgi:hypothetical protein
VASHGLPHQVRALCRALVEQPCFDALIMLLILGSTLSLALDSPRNDPNSELEVTLSLLDVVWTAAFTCELLLKVIAYGFVGGKGTYLSCRSSPSCSHSRRYGSCECCAPCASSPATLA